MYDQTAMVLLNELCERMGVDAKLVRSITITPKAITADVFLVNEQGSKFVKDDGHVALETQVLPFSYVVSGGVKGV